MQLTTVQFQRIIKAEGTSTAGRPALVPAGCRVAAERRKTPRVSLGRRVQMQVSKPGADARWQTAVVRDVCETGLSVLTDTRLVQGDLFVVRFQTGPGQHLCVESQVAWAEAGGYGSSGYIVGAAFVRLIEHQSFVVKVVDEPAIAGGNGGGRIELKPARPGRSRRGRFGVTDTVVAVFDAARALCGRRLQDDFR